MFVVANWKKKPPTQQGTAPLQHKWLQKAIFENHHLGSHLGCLVALAYFDDLNDTEPKDITLEERLWQCLF